MKIEYSRSLMTSHMILEAGEPLAEWEEAMIANVTVEGIIFAETVEENGRNRLWYDITGKQSLQQFLESGELGYDLLEALLINVYEMEELLEELLLDTNAILLLPETIYVDYRTGKISFCYYPGWDEALSEAFVSLLEYLLIHLNHADERAVKLAYDAYEQIPKGSIKMLADLLHSPYEQDMPEEVFEEVEGITELPKKEMPEGKREARSKLQEALCAFRMFLETELQRVMRGRLLQKNSTEEYVFTPEEEDKRQVITRPTVLLSELNRPVEGILRYEGNGTCADLEINGESFVIGSDSTCEGYVPSATVSRKHARITRNGDVFFVEDLNSANGTYVGGTLLDYRTKMSLTKNEIILFADEKFRFI